jgi:CRISPR-associated protein Csm2
MTQSPKRPKPHPEKIAEISKDNQHPKTSSQSKPRNQNNNEQEDKDEDIVSKMVSTINDCKDGLHQYGTRPLVEDTEKLGKFLADQGLKTNQIRKFLDAVNQLRVELRGSTTLTDIAKSDLDLLRPKLAYAAARQRKKDDPGPVEPLRKVLEAAIKQVNEKPDFERLAQLIESVVAYHKAAGGTDQ